MKRLGKAKKETKTKEVLVDEDVSPFEIDLEKSCLRVGDIYIRMSDISSFEIDTEDGNWCVYVTYRGVYARRLSYCETKKDAEYLISALMDIVGWNNVFEVPEIVIK